MLANIDQGEALRDRIKALTAELKIHEDIVKDVLGEATDGRGRKRQGRGPLPVPQPLRALQGEGQGRSSPPRQYAKCETVTEYRTLLYGEG